MGVAAAVFFHGCGLVYEGGFMIRWLYRDGW